jgi:hypothetical protein
MSRAIEKSATTSDGFVARRCAPAAKWRGAPASKWLNSPAGCRQRRREDCVAAREPTHTAHSGLYEAVERRIGAGEHPPARWRPRERASTDSTAREARTPVQAFNSQAIGARCLCPRPMAMGVRYSPDASCSASSRSFRPTERTATSATSRKASSQLLDTGHFALEAKLDEMAR